MLWADLALDPVWLDDFLVMIWKWYDVLQAVDDDFVHPESNNKTDLSIGGTLGEVAHRKYVSHTFAVMRCEMWNRFVCSTDWKNIRILAFCAISRQWTIFTLAFLRLEKLKKICPTFFRCYQYFHFCFYEIIAYSRWHVFQILLLWSPTDLHDIQLLKYIRKFVNCSSSYSLIHSRTHTWCDFYYIAIYTWFVLCVIVAFRDEKQVRSPLVNFISPKHTYF